MDWRAKAVVQNVLAVVPFGSDLNNLLQLRVGGLRNFEAHVEGKVKDWIGMMNLLAESGVDIRNAVTVEIGTGWFPTLPVCFWLAGTQACNTYDQKRHLRLGLTRRLVFTLEPHLESIAEAAGLPFAPIQERYKKIGSDILAACEISYRAPADAARTGLPDQSVDIVFSNSVLEHVTPCALTAIMQETRRILRPAGAAVHCVACNDHYAHFDQSISYVNYLRFTAPEWRRWNNSLQYQNRLRASDFLQVAESCGLTVTAARQYVRPGVEPALSRLPIAPDFERYSRSELAVTTVNFVCRASP
ncbi:MAG TPA: class I SAM-dependent methyltransferase [Candidatus Bathyarchaeia archaeon]|nr:class I SAM-dependent methyltransferase [Candidatus Bathyarchaeia archaeon]